MVASVEARKEAREEAVELAEARGARHCLGTGNSVENEILALPGFVFS